MDSTPTSPEHAPFGRQKPEVGSDKNTRKKEDERKHKLGGMLLSATPEKDDKNGAKNQKKPEVKPEKADARKLKLVKPPEAPEAKPVETQPTPEEDSGGEAQQEKETMSRTRQFIDNLKALRREQEVITAIETAQPEVKRARSLAQKILQKVRGDKPVADKQNWRTVPLPPRHEQQAQALDLVLREGQEIDLKLESAVRERHLRLVSLEDPHTATHAVGFRNRLRGIMFPALAVSAGASIAGGAASHGAEMIAPASRALGLEAAVPTLDTTVPRAETGSLIFGAAALFVAGLIVGRRRGERRAEARFERERQELQAEAQMVHEDTVELPQQPQQVEQLMQHEILTQKQITNEQAQRLQEVTALQEAPAAVMPERPMPAAAASSEFKLPGMARTFEAAPQPVAAAALTPERQAYPGPEKAVESAKPVIEAAEPAAEAKLSPTMTEYAMKPIIIQRLERITGNRHSAEHVYELLKASHSSPAEILALNPEKLKAKVDDALKRDAARVVLGKTLKTGVDADVSNAIAEETTNYALMHELQNQPAAMSPKEFLLQPSKQRDRALIAVGVVTIVVAGLLFFL